MTTSTILFSFRVSTALKERLDSLAEATQRSKSFLAAEAIERYIQEQTWQPLTSRKASGRQMQVRSYPVKRSIVGSPSGELPTNRLGPDQRSALANEVSLVRQALQDLLKIHNAQEWPEDF